MPPARFEPTIPASERQQTYALDRADTGISKPYHTKVNFMKKIKVLWAVAPCRLENSNYQSPRRQIPQDFKLYHYCCEDLKYYTILINLTALF
jgi:hypothetical protein